MVHFFLLGIPIIDSSVLSFLFDLFPEKKAQKYPPPFCCVFNRGQSVFQASFVDLNIFSRKNALNLKLLPDPSYFYLKSPLSLEMTFATFVEPTSPDASIPASQCHATSFSIRVCDQQLTENSSADSLQSSEDGEEVYPFVTFATLNDIDEVQVSLIDTPECMDREDSDDSLFQILIADKSFAPKRVTFKPMVKVLHYDRDEFAAPCTDEDEERRVPTFRLAPHEPIEPVHSFVSSVSFFVGDDDDDADF